MKSNKCTSINFINQVVIEKSMEKWVKKIITYENRSSYRCVIFPSNEKANSWTNLILLPLKSLQEGKRGGKVGLNYLLTHTWGLNAHASHVCLLYAVCIHILYTFVIPGHEHELISTGMCFSRCLTQSIFLSWRLQMQLSGQEHCCGNCAFTPTAWIPKSSTAISTKFMFPVNPAVPHAVEEFFFVYKRGLAPLRHYFPGTCARNSIN